MPEGKEDEKKHAEQKKRPRTPSNQLEHPSKVHKKDEDKDKDGSGAGSNSAGGSVEHSSGTTVLFSNGGSSGGAGNKHTGQGVQKYAHRSIQR